MAKGFELNRQGLRQMEREIQRGLDKMRLTVPIGADPQIGPPLNSPLRGEQDRLLRAMYELEAFNSLCGKDLDVIAEQAGLDHDMAKDMLERSKQDGLVESTGYAAGGHLTIGGRQYVERLDQPEASPASGPTFNFHAPVTNTQFATGDDASQVMINNTVDTAVLAELIAAVRDLDVSELRTDEQGNLAADLQILEAQLHSPTEVPGYRRALRTVKDAATQIAVSASGSTIATGIIDLAQQLLAATA